MRFNEDKEQETLFVWAAYIPQCRHMFAIPSGGKRNIREAARLKKQGVKRGISDIFLPVPSGQFSGLFLELKRRKADGPSRVSKEQREFQQAMILAGYQAEVCYGCEEAVTVIKAYLML